tara:strand:- start:503 stop:838 length:336 start_codon:yes stop_codon:yes gene_type:complete
MRELEKDVERVLVRGIKQLGGDVRKLSWVGRRGAPDRLVFLPPGSRLPLEMKRKRKVESWRMVFVELKTRHGKLSRLQEIEIRRLRAMQLDVVVLKGADHVEAWLHGIICV